jgi:hypothetical protein
MISQAISKHVIIIHVDLGNITYIVQTILKLYQMSSCSKWDVLRKKSPKPFDKALG